MPHAKFIIHYQVFCYEDFSSRSLVPMHNANMRILNCTRASMFSVHAAIELLFKNFNPQKPNRNEKTITKTVELFS